MSGKLALEARGLQVRGALVISLAASFFTLAPVQNGNAQQRAGVPAHGKTIAETWCSACHLVSPEQTRANADVPTFLSISKRLPTDADVLAAFIANPHPPMPNLSLSRQEIQDLLAYIATLQ